jgi:large subunit ribosomal protein L30
MKTFKVTLKGSTIGATQVQKDTIRCIGLRGIGSSVVIKDNPAQRGQIFKMQQWLSVEVQK